MRTADTRTDIPTAWSVEFARITAMLEAMDVLTLATLAHQPILDTTELFQ
jgi:hypothetical protein